MSFKIRGLRLQIKPSTLVFKYLTELTTYTWRINAMLLDILFNRHRKHYMISQVLTTRS